MIKKFISILIVIFFSLSACADSHTAFIPNSAFSSSLLKNQAKDEFETGAYHEKDPVGMWVIGIIAGAAIVGTAVLVPLYVNNKL